MHPQAAKHFVACLENGDHPVHTGLKIKTVMLGEINLDVGPAVLDPKWNRMYPFLNTPVCFIPGGKEDMGECGQNLMLDETDISFPHYFK